MATILRAGALAPLMLSFAAPALAGAANDLRANEEAVLQLDYKGQLQMMVRDIGSSPTNDEATTNFNFRRKPPGAEGLRRHAQPARSD